MSLRDFRFSFQANQVQEITVSGNFFSVLEATDDVYLSIDGGAYIKRVAGHSQKENYFSILIKSLVAQNIVIIAGVGDFISANQNVTVNTNTTVQGGNTNTALADVIIPALATVQIAGANANRKQLIVKALFANDPAVFVRVGTGADATHGAELGAGEALPELFTEGAISIHNPGAVDFTVSILEINRI